MSMIKIKPLASAIILAIAGADVIADEFTLEEIVVTATKRSQNLQDVPVAVNAFSAETIQDAGINDATDLANLTPSLDITVARDPFTSRLAIRGIGTAQNDPALEPSVGMFADGVFLGRSGLGMSDLTDIERIEVLQGPQGTLYGKNTNAGAISVITKRPNLEEFEGYAQFSVGNYGMQKATLAASGPLSDTVAYRVSGSTHQRDGFYDNTGTSDPGDADDWNIQGKLLWEPSDNLSVLLSVSHVDRDTNSGGFDTTHSETVKAELANQGLPQIGDDPYDYDIGHDTENTFEMESDTVSLHVEYDMDWGTLTSITAWNDYDYLTRSDADGSLLDIIASMGEPYAGDSVSQEFRLDSTVGDSIEYQVGLFYHESTNQRGDGGIITMLGDDFVEIAGAELLGANQVIGPLPVIGLLEPMARAAAAGDYIAGKNVWDSETLAVFGQMTWHATEDLHLTAGLRWTDEEKEADLFTEIVSTSLGTAGIPAPVLALIPANLQDFMNDPFINRLSTEIDDTFKRRSINTDWLLKAAYDLDENSMVYASVSTGTKSGNFNGVSGPADTREFDDEHTKSYELGFKSTMLDSRLRLNAAAFFSEINDFQFQFALEDGGSSVNNEGAVEVSGLDISVQALPLPNLTLEAGLLYMDKYEVTEGPNKDKELAFTADWSGNLAATLVFPLDEGTVYLRGDYTFMDDHWTTNSDSRTKAVDWDKRTVFNARVGWRNENWNLSLWGKNLTDDEYASMTNNLQTFSGNQSYVLAAPRTYGVDVRYDF